MVAHLRPHISNLKATFVFLRSIFSRLLYDITARRLRAEASSPCVGSNSTIIHFPHYLFIITHSNKCAVWRCFIHQRKWPGSVHCQPPRLPSLPLTSTRCYNERDSIFHLLSVGNILWQSNNLFLWMSNNVSSEEFDKGVQAAGIASWLFWSARSPLTATLQSKQQVVLPTEAAFIRVSRGFFSRPHQTQMA